MAIEPPAGSPAGELPLAKPIGEWTYELPPETVPLPLTVKGEIPSEPGPRAAPADRPAGILLDEGFEGGAMPPAGGWSVINTHPTRNWTIVDVGTYPDFVHSGTYAGWVNYDTPTASDEWLLTPVIDLTGIPDASIEFWAYSDTNWCPGGGTGATMILHVTDTGGTPLATLWDMCADETWSTSIYRSVTKDLSAYQGQQIKLAWQYVGIDGQSFGLDDISVTGTGGTPVADLEPESQRGLGDPCEVLQYDLTVWNYTGQSDTFDVTYSGNTWVVGGPSQVGPVADSASSTFQVSVTIPCNAVCPECDTVTVEAQAQASPVASDTATIETCVGDDWQTESNTGAVGAHWMAYTCTDQEGTQGTCYYFGGLGPGNNLTGYAQKYDVAAGTWTSITPLPTPVFAAAAAYIDGKVYVAGGFTSTTSPWPATGALQIYDVDLNSWSAGPDLPVPRGALAGGALAGKFYVANGQDPTYVYRYTHEYNPATNQWTEVASSPDFSSFGAGTASDSFFYIGGDYFGENGFFEYEAATNTWEERADLPAGAGKKSPVMAAVDDCGGVFLYGGDLGEWTDYQDTTWYWHPLADTWINYGATLNSATTGAGGGVVNSRLWSFAGSLGSGPIDPVPHESLAYCCPASPPNGFLSGHVYDTNTGLPIEDALITLDGVTDIEFSDDTYSLSDGSYQIGPALVNDYEAWAAAYGYYNSAPAPVAISDGMTTTLDIYLDAAKPLLSDNEASLTVAPNSTEVFSLTLTNDGSGDLVFHLTELANDSVYPLPTHAKAMPTGVDPDVYADLDAAADGTAKFIVYLKDQADLSAAFDIRDRSPRGHYVLNALQATAERSQAGLRADLDEAGLAYKAHYIVNALVVEGTVDTVESLAARPEVAFIGPNTEIPAPDPVTVSGMDSPEAVSWGINKVRAQEVWTDFGVYGEGVIVANIDTGVDYDHPALVQQYRGTQGGGSYDHNYNWWDPYGYDTTEPVDWHNHGSHTMGTMLGSDNPADPASATNIIGLAPRADWFACQGFDKFLGYGTDEALMTCAEFVLAPWDLAGANPDPDLRADVVNNSWGGGQAEWWYNQIIYAWRAAGMIGIFSAGNEGPNCATMGDPGDMPNILAVGATDPTDSNAPGSPADFSSRGPTNVTGLIKPNVSAPGSDIFSALANGTYGYMGGTSMAAPHVSGEAALLWSAVPELKGNVQLTYWIIEQGTDPLLVDQGYFCGADTASNVPNNQYGWGRIDAHEAVSLTLNSIWDVAWLDVDPQDGLIAPAASEEIALTFDSTGLPSGECYTATLKIEFNDPYTTEVLMPLELCVEEAAYRLYLPLVSKQYAP
jgi:subtilisin family serine protease